MKQACIFIIYAYCCLFLLTGYEQGKEVPTEIKKVDLKLKQEELAITFLNLSNGEGTLVQNEKGEGLLINSGHEESQLELKKYLDVYGISQINTLILTKLDPHYIGNLHYLINQYHIRQVIIPSLTEDESTQSVDIPVTKWGEGEQVFEKFGLSVKVLQIDDEKKAMNLLLNYGENRFLFMSTDNEEQELELTKKFKLKDVNILKVAEFAKKTGTSQKLLEEVDPQVAVIFQKSNSYPSADVLERLQSTWIDIYYTKQFGNVTVKCSHDNYEVITLSIESINRL
ncbi:hypothetical protein FZW96_02515 [Bacillus sp. BGMRC 2118]|nr:hypothetical protein FZW96_02515 [Bacillus sp. BGMRC 2118]